MQLLAEDLKEKKGRCNVLDFFGSGSFITDDGKIDSVTGVRVKALNVPRPDNFSIIEGNLFELKVWKLIKNRLSYLGVDGFDLITCRPFGGFPMFSSSPIEGQLLVYGSLLEKTIKLLASERSILFSQIPLTLGRANMFEVKNGIYDIAAKNDCQVIFHNQKLIFKIAK